MKRTERHHLKENELEKFARRAREAVETRRRETMAGIVVLVVIGAVGIGYWTWRERVETRAQAMLAAALAVQEARVGPPVAPGLGAASTPSFATERERSLAALAKFKAAAPTHVRGVHEHFAKHLGSETNAVACALERVALARRS